MTTLDMINIARRYPQAGDCQVDLLSSMGGAIELAAAVRVETQAMPASLARYAAVILPGFFAEDVASLTQQLQTLWQPAMARLRTMRPGTLVAASCYGTFVLAEKRLAGRAPRHHHLVAAGGLPATLSRNPSGCRPGLGG